MSSNISPQLNRKAEPHTYASCKVCSHPLRAEIEQKMLEGTSPRQLEDMKYGMRREAFQEHHDEHLIPFLQEAQSLARQGVAKQLSGLSNEVYVPLMEKVKLGQDLALKAFRANIGSPKVGLQNVAIRALSEFRKWVGEEARITGEYQKERQNVNDLKADRLKKAIKQKADELGITYYEELRFYLNSEFADDILPAVKRELMAELAELQQQERVEIAQGKVVATEARALEEVRESQDTGGLSPEGEDDDSNDGRNGGDYLRDSRADDSFGDNVPDEEEEG